MPRLGKKKKEEWAFFLNQYNRKSYNELCKTCRKDCKQSFHTIVCECPKYQKKQKLKIQNEGKETQDYENERNYEKQN